MGCRCPVVGGCRCPREPRRLDGVALSRPRSSDISTASCPHWSSRSLQAWNRIHHNEENSREEPPNMLPEHVHADFSLTNTGQNPNPIHTFLPLTLTASCPRWSSRSSQTWNRIHLNKENSGAEPPNILLEHVHTDFAHTDTGQNPNPIHTIWPITPIRPPTLRPVSRQRDWFTWLVEDVVRFCSIWVPEEIMSCVGVAIATKSHNISPTLGLIERIRTTSGR